MQTINLHGKDQSVLRICEAAVVTVNEFRQFANYGLIGVSFLVSFKITHQVFCLCGSTECVTYGNLNDKILLAGEWRHFRTRHHGPVVFRLCKEGSFIVSLLLFALRLLTVI